MFNLLPGWGVMLGCSALVGLAAFLFGVWLYGPLRSQFSRMSIRQAERLFHLFDLMFIRIKLSNCQLIVWSGCLSLALLFALLTFPLGWASLLFIAAAGLVGWSLPIPVLRFMWRRRVKQVDAQLVGALTMMASALRSGLTMVQAIDIVSREMPPPISQEFTLVLREQKMGRRLEEALETLSARLPSQDLTLVSNSILVLRETGGNLPLVFESILTTILERKRVEGRIQALTSEGVTQGVVLTAMPFVMGAILYYLNPEYMRPLFSTVFGWIFIVFILMLLSFGVWMMRRIIDIDV